MASESGGAQTFYVSVCLQMDKLVDEYINRGCDITNNQYGALELILEFHTES